MLSPCRHSWNFHGPEPTTRDGSCPVAPPSVLHSEMGTLSQMCFGMTTECNSYRNVTRGSLATTSNVCSSITRHDSVASRKFCAYDEPRSGLAKESNENFTSSALISTPSCHVASLLRWNVYVRPSGATSQ